MKVTGLTGIVEIGQRAGCGGMSIIPRRLRQEVLSNVGRPSLKKDWRCRSVVKCPWGSIPSKKKGGGVEKKKLGRETVSMNRK